MRSNPLVYSLLAASAGLFSTLSLSGSTPVPKPPAPVIIQIDERVFDRLESIVEEVLETAGTAEVETTPVETDKLRSILGAEYDRFEDLLRNYRSLPNAIELAEVLDTEFRPMHLDVYENFLKLGSVDDLRIAKFHLGDSFRYYHIPNIMEILKHPRGLNLIEARGNFFPGYAKTYIMLLDRGEDPIAIAGTPRFNLLLYARDIENGEIPPDETVNLTSHPEQYSIEAAGGNPIYGTDTSKLKDYIKERLSVRDHCERPNTDYIEDLSQIDDIYNINMLYLIKGYLDFLDDPANQIRISELIDADLENVYSEVGGFVVSNDGKYQLVPYSGKINESHNLEDNSYYGQPQWIRSVGHIGIFHLHADTEDASIYCGPSGSVKYADAVDIGALVNANETNKYQIDMVITKMSGESFNVDVFFRDVYYFRPIKLNASRATVIDLGIYEKPSSDKTDLSLEPINP